MPAKLFFSHKMEMLAELLVQYLEERPAQLLLTRTILTPNPQIRQWLFLEIAKRKNIAMGIRIVDIYDIFPKKISTFNAFCSIYRELSHVGDEEVLAYLEGRPRRKLDLAGELTSLFFSYEQYGRELFLTPAANWQQALLQKIFPIETALKSDEELICFGFDSLPSSRWDFLFSSPQLAVFLFSPCAEFWADLYADKEKRLLPAGARGAIENYVQDAPPLLANLGKVGRQTLLELDRFAFETEECYPDIESNSSLKKLQHSLLSFQKVSDLPNDGSVQISLTGNSLWQEVEALRDAILALDIPYSDVAVLAPDIEPYVPLIELLFAEKIPYRIVGVNVQSPFRQGLIRLTSLNRWDAKEILTLFETPSFKHKFDEKQLATFRKWLIFADVQFGKDAEHRRQMLSATIGDKEYEDTGSWELGLRKLLKTLYEICPLQVNADLFEEFLSLIVRLKKLALHGEKTLGNWADILESAIEEFLEHDEGDIAFLAFQSLLKELRSFNDEALYPFSVIQRHLNCPISGQIHPTHLHAVQIGSLEEGLPAKAIFLIGMSEENFPRIKISSSFDLIKGKALKPADRDRYCFLKALFFAEEALHISYCHLSADEGKPVGASLVVQELISHFATAPVSSYRARKGIPSAKTFSWPKFLPPSLPKGKVSISIQDLKLLARHPWRFYLQRGHGMYLNLEQEITFLMQKGGIRRALLEHEEVRAPRGRLGEVLFNLAQEEVASWDVKPEVLEVNLDVPIDDFTCHITGEIKMASAKGLILPKDDFASLVKGWPEALIAAHITKVPAVWNPKSGKPKELTGVDESLKAFLRYYFAALEAPSPLLPEWADDILRKNRFSTETSFVDPVVDWVLARAEIARPDDWTDYLKMTFAELIAR